MAAYAISADLASYGVPAAALARFDSAAQTSSLEGASSLIDSYLASRYTLPLVSWGDDLRRAACIITLYDLMSGLGFSPMASADENLRRRYEDVIAWLRGIAAGSVTPVSVVDSTPSTTENGAAIYSYAKRGW